MGDTISGSDANYYGSDTSQLQAYAPIALFIGRFVYCHIRNRKDTKDRLPK